MSNFIWELCGKLQQRKWQSGLRKVAAMLLAVNLILVMLPSALGNAASAVEAVSPGDAQQVVEPEDTGKDEPTVPTVSDSDTGKQDEPTQIVSGSDLGDNPISSGDVGDQDTLDKIEGEGAEITPDPVYGMPQIVMTTALPIGSEIFLHIEFNDIVYIDWGNGNITTVTETGMVSGVLCDNTVKLYSPEDITLFYCSNKSLTALDVGNCAALEYLSCGENNLTELDVSKNTALKRLWCDSNNLTELDVSSNTALDILVCSSNSLMELDVSKNTALFEFHCDENNLIELDLSQNKELERLLCGGNSLTALDVSKNTALKYLSCDSNNLIELDVSNCAFLEILICCENKLTELNVSDCTALFVLECNDNQLVSLDLSNTSNVNILECGNNALSALNISGIKSMDIFNCRNNNLAFSNITGAENINNFMHAYYMFQPDIEIPAYVETNSSIDLSSEYNIGGAITEYMWFYGDDNSVIRTDVSASDVSCSDLIPDNLSEAVPSTASNGAFSFDGDFVGEKLFCVLTNSNLPDLVLTTTVVEITEASADFGDPKITMTTDLPVDSFMNLYFTASDTVYIDWGDGEIVEYDRYGKTAGSKIKIYCDGEIREFDCGYSELTSLDVSNCAALTKLSCEDAQITTIDLSANTALEDLNCAMTNLTALDVSKNTALKKLNCIGVTFAELDLSKNVALTSLDISDTELTTLNVSNCTVLEYLCAYSSELTELDVSNCIALKYLECQDNNLTSLDVSKNTELTLLRCAWNDLKTLDISNNRELNYLHCDAANLTSLDISNNLKLGTLQCSENDLGTLDISKHTELKYLECSGTNLTTLNVSNNTALKALICSSNNLKELDVSKNIDLNCVYCDNNNLTALDLSNNSKLSEVKCDSNELLFSTMSVNIANIYSGEYDESTYTPQSDVQIPATVETGVEIDLSSEYDIDGTKTVYTWYDAADDSVVTPATSANGVFTFGEDLVGKTLYCTMTNALFPDLTLKTTEVTVEEKTLDLGEPKIIMTTAQTIDGDIFPRFTADDTIYIDQGDGVIVEYEYPCVVKGSAIKVYCLGNITELECQESKLTSLDVSACTELKKLDCFWNQLTSLDVSSNTELEWLDCSFNSLTQLDVTKNTKLIRLDFSSNDISEINVRNNTALMILGCSECMLSSLDISKNTALTSLCCSGNNLTELDSSNNPAFEYLECRENNLTELDFSNNPEIYYLECWNNNLKFSTIIELDVDKPDTYYYYSDQNDVKISETTSCNIGVDLSSEYDIDGTKTVYTWYDAADDSVATPATSENGVFTFGKDLVGKTLYCTMTNALFPDLTLKTTEVTVEEAEGEFEVIDKNDHVGAVEPDEDSSFEDENGEEVDLGSVRLVVSNVAGSEESSVREAIEAYNKEFEATDDNHAMYEIHLETDEGVEVDMTDGRIRICLKYPDNLGAECADYTYHLYHIKDDGTVEEIAIEANPNGIWFYADDFSPYVLIYELKEENESGGSGDSSGEDSEGGDSTGGSGDNTGGDNDDGSGEVLGGNAGNGGSSNNDGKGPSTGDITAKDNSGAILAANLVLMALMLAAAAVARRRDLLPAICSAVSSVFGSRDAQEK